LIQTYFNKILQDVPQYNRFLKIKEIENILKTFRKSQIIKELIIGKTADNKPLRMYTFGKGKKTALIIGVPHSDEPLGSLVTIHLINWMANHPKAQFFEWRWLIIPILEQRGMTMNEGWFHNYSSLEKTAKFYYRESTEEQYEWTFPFEYQDYKWVHSRPESKAILEVIKNEKPDLLCNLHHSGFYNTYFYFSEDLPEAYLRLRKLSNSLKMPLSSSNPDVLFSKSFSPGFYKMYGLRDYIDFYQRYKPEKLFTIRRGACSDEWYLDRIGGFSFNCEVPLFSSSIKKDNNTSKIELKKLLKKSELTKTKNVQYCVDILKKIEPFFNSANYLLLNSVLKTIANTKMSLNYETTKIRSIEDRNATNFELFENNVMVHMENLIRLGQIWRIMKNIYDTEKNAKILKLLKQIDIKISKQIKKINLKAQFEPIPIQRLIKMQVGSILIITDILASKN